MARGNRNFYRRALPRDEDRLVNLKSNELLHPALPPLLADGLAALSGEAIGRYPRLGSLLQLLARHHRVPAESIVLSGGSDVVIRMLAYAIGSERGPLILQSPNYEAWEAQRALLGLKVVRVEFGTPARGEFAFPALEAAAARENSGLVVISNPNGPTGWSLSEAEVLRLADLAAEREHLLVVDECYGAFGGLDHLRLLGVRQHVVVLHSYSKVFGMAGARLAATVGPAWAVAALRAWQPEGTVSAAAVVLVQHMIAHLDVLEAVWSDIAATRTWFARSLEALDQRWLCLPSGGNFVNVRMPTPDDARGLHERLLAEGIRTRAMNGVAGLDGCVRFTIADHDTMKRVLKVVDRFAAEKDSS